MGALPSWPNQLSKSLLLILSPWSLVFQDGFWEDTNIHSIADTIYYNSPLAIRYKYLFPSLVTLRTEQTVKNVRRELVMRMKSLLQMTMVFIHRWSVSLLYKKKNSIGHSNFLNCYLFCIFPYFQAPGRCLQWAYSAFNSEFNSLCIGNELLSSVVYWEQIWIWIPNFLLTSSVTSNKLLLQL